MFPFLFAADIVNFSRLEVVHDISKGAAGVFNVVKDALVTEVNGVRLVSQCFVDKGRNDTSVGAVVLVRAIGVDRANPYRLRTKHHLRV